MQNHEVIVDKNEKGYIAAATASPYFCFVADTEDALKEKVRSALGFFHSIADKHNPSPRHAIELTPVLGKRISTRELEVA